LREIFHHEDAKGAKEFLTFFWRAVRGSARVLALTEFRKFTKKVKIVRMERKTAWENRLNKFPGWS